MSYRVNREKKLSHDAENNTAITMSTFQHSKPFSCIFLQKMQEKGQEV